MVAEAEIARQQSVSVAILGKGSNICEIGDLVTIEPSLSPPDLHQVRVSDSDVSVSASQVDMKSVNSIADTIVESDILKFVPSIRSGSFADIGPRRYMEDEHICIDDLSTQLGSLFEFPKPSALYGVFDGHGGPEAAAYIRKHVMRLFFEEVNFPQASEVNDMFLKEVESSLLKAFLLADLALADDQSVSSSSGTTALAAFVFGRLLMVANTGDCRAVLCRKGEAIDMSQDHRPSHPPERRRVEALGGFIDDGYLNGVLSVTRALGDWDMKLPPGSPSPLIPDPEFQTLILTEEDEFLIIGCDGIWDVMTSQHAVSLVRRGLRRHDDPEQCAKDLVMEALRRRTFDNLTVVVVCFSSGDHQETLPSPRRRVRRFCLSSDAMCSLRSLLESSTNV